jgi:hypothetical protein
MIFQMKGLSRTNRASSRLPQALRKRDDFSAKGTVTFPSCHSNGAHTNSCHTDDVPRILSPTTSHAGLDERVNYNL